MKTSEQILEEIRLAIASNSESKKKSNTVSFTCGERNK